MLLLWPARKTKQKIRDKSAHHQCLTSFGRRSHRMTHRYRSYLWLCLFSIHVDTQTELLVSLINAIIHGVKSHTSIIMPPGPQGSMSTSDPCWATAVVQSRNKTACLYFENCCSTWSYQNFPFISYDALICSVK